MNEVANMMSHLMVLNCGCNYAAKIDIAIKYCGRNYSCDVI